MEANNTGCERDETTAELLRYAREVGGTPRGIAARDAAIERNLRLARGIAFRYTGRGVELEDLVQVASLALVLATQRFDPDRGSAFTAYASVTIHGELKRHLRDHGWAVRPVRADHDRYHRVVAAGRDLEQTLGAEPTTADIAQYLGMDAGLVRAAQQLSLFYTAASLDTVAAESPGVLEQHSRTRTTHDPIDAATTAVSLDQSLRSFSSRDRLVISLRFQQDLTQQQIATRLGISQMQVSRSLVRITAGLRTLLEDAFHCPAC